MQSKGITIPRPKYEGFSRIADHGVEEDEDDVDDDEDEDEDEDRPVRNGKLQKKNIKKANHEATDDEEDE